MLLADFSFLFLWSSYDDRSFSRSKSFYQIQSLSESYKSHWVHSVLPDHSATSCLNGFISFWRRIPQIEWKQYEYEHSLHILTLWRIRGKKNQLWEFLQGAAFLNFWRAGLQRATSRSCLAPSPLLHLPWAACGTGVINRWGFVGNEENF